jgi:hypothetical protein
MFIQRGQEMEMVKQLNPDEEALVLKQLPLWKRLGLHHDRITEILHLSFTIPAFENMDDLSKYVFEHAPSPIKAQIVPGVVGVVDPAQLATIALYPSGTLRTIGVASCGSTPDSVWLELSDYWCLLDPDDGHESEGVL